MRLPLHVLVDGGEQGGARSCREVISGALRRGALRRGALRRGQLLRFLWDGRFDSGLRQEAFFILEPGPKSLKIQSVLLVAGSHNEMTFKH